VHQRTLPRKRKANLQNGEIFANLDIWANHQEKDRQPNSKIGEELE
jgi:hypothetical protein